MLWTSDSLIDSLRWLGYWTGHLAFVASGRSSQRSLSTVGPALVELGYKAWSADGVELAEAVEPPDYCHCQRCQLELECSIRPV